MCVQIKLGLLCAIYSAWCPFCKFNWYGESTENDKALLFFFGKETIQTFDGFHLSHFDVVCEVINLWIAMFENSAKIYLKTFAWFDPSIKSYFLMVSSLILLRSLRVYILKQLFFSISVNSGFRNIYLSASRLRKYLATIHLDFNNWFQ